MSKKKRYWIQPPPKIKQTRHSNPSMGPQWPVNSPTKTLWPTDFDLGKMFKSANSQDLKRQRLADRTNLTDDLDSYRVWPVDSQNG